jgi:hypothetical protein
MNKKIYIIISFCVLASANLISQTFTWANAYSGTTGFPATPRSLQVDASGNVYDVGTFRGTHDFDPGAGTFSLTSSSSLNDTYIVKRNSAGNFLWAKKFGGTGQDVCGRTILDAASNIYIIGYFDALADFDPGVGVFNMTPVGSNDVFLIKLDPNGNFIWAKSFGGTTSEVAYGLTIDASNNIIFSGTFTSPSVDFDPGVGTFTMSSLGGQEGFVCKLDAGGNFIWAKDFGNSTCVFSNLATDALGNVYSAGYFTIVIDFDPGAAVASYTSISLSADMFLHKMDGNGNFIWVKQIGSSIDERVNNIARDASNNLYCIGTFSSTLDFDPSASVYTITAVGANDAFVAKYDINGNFIWAKSFGSTSFEDVGGLSFDATGNVLTSGSFNSTCDFDPGAGVYNLTSPGGSDGFISRLDPAGNFISANRIGNTGSDVCAGITSDAASNIYVNGSFAQTVDFDPGVSTYTMVGNGSGYMLKWAGCSGPPSTPGTISGLTSLCTGATATTYSINSISGASSYNWSLPGAWTGSSTSNTISATPGSSGVFSVTATNPCGTSAEQTLSVTINPLPIVTILRSDSVICGPPFQGTSILTANGATTYLWNTSASTASIAVSPSVTTIYTVTGTDNNGCTKTSTITQVVSGCIGINELSNQNSQFSIYPNPTNCLITINGVEGNVSIYNVLGEQILTAELRTSNSELNLSNLPNGIYFIRIGAVTKKILKQ